MAYYWLHELYITLDAYVLEHATRQTNGLVDDLEKFNWYTPLFASIRESKLFKRKEYGPNKDGKTGKDSPLSPGIMTTWA